MTERSKILLVDDEPEILEMFQAMLVDEDYDVSVAQSGEEAITLFKRQGADVVVTDIRMPGMSGLQVLRTIKALDDKVEVIVLTGHASIEVAISALRNDGAFDFLTKPLDRLDDLLIPIEKALANRNLVQENALLLEELSRRQVYLEVYNNELRETKHALEVSRYRYEDLYDQAPVGYLTLSADGCILDVNKTAATLLGYPKARICERPITDFIVSCKDAGCFHRSEDLMEHIPQSSEVQMIRSNGKRFYAHLESLAILKSDGEVEQVRMTIMDINEQKLVELALKESEQRYRSFVENFNGIAFCVEEDGSPVFYHGAVEEATGYSEAELVRGRPDWQSMIHPEELELVQSRRRILCTADDRSIAHEYRIRHRNRQWRWMREHIHSLRSKGSPKRQLHGVVFDITEQKQLQAQYVESRKLDAIATMASGIAHQFNNSLAGLMGNLELLSMDMEQDRNITSYTDPMMELVQSMAQLTKQLLAYARGGKYLPTKISAHDLVHQSINLMTHRLSDKFDVNLQFAAERDQIIADTTQLQMVFMAVIENAIEAMTDGGTITIETHMIECRRETVKSGISHPPGRYLRISIKDSGCGMDQETAEKIFDPFFTTKFIGRGLGLSAAYGIVVNHRGWMEVETGINKGSEMKIWLPLSASQTPIQEAPDPGQLVKGDATVLVIEDEEMVLKAVRQLLDRLEYRVLEARTGHEALEILRTFSGQIDIALLDVRLPDLEAVDLYEKIINIRPDLKVIVCSGYDKDGPVEKLLASGALAFLQKPFSVARLSAEILAALEANGKGKADPKSHLRVI